MSWPPRKGELWLTLDRWPATEVDPEVPSGALVMVLGGVSEVGPWGGEWWGGEVLGPAGKRFIKATPDELIPGDDPRLTAPEFTRSA